MFIQCVLLDEAPHIYIYIYIIYIYIYINNPPVTYEKNNIPFHDMVTWWVNMGQSF